MRARGDTLMTLTLRAYAPNGTTTVNEQETFAFTPKSSTKGELRGGSITTRDTVTRTITIGSVEVPVVEGGLRIPISAQVPKGGARGVGWEYVVTGVGSTDDPALIGRRYLVVNSPAESRATRRRLDVAEVPQ